MRRHVRHVCVGVWLLAACSEPPPDLWWMFGDAPASGIDVPEAMLSPAPVVASFPVDGVSQISTARLGPDRTLGVVDLRTCQVILYRLGADAAPETERLGRCGEGPGEFRGITDILIEPDTVVVVDHDQQILTFLPRRGGTPRLLELRDLAEQGWRAFEILRTDGAVILAAGVLPGAGLHATSGFLRVIDRGDASQISEFAPDPPAAGANVSQLPRRVSACLDAGSGSVFIANRWRMERVILSGDGQRVLRRLITPGSWVLDVVRDDRPGAVPAAYVRLACGDGDALFQWRTRAEGGGVDRYHTELITSDGSTAWSSTGREPESPHPAAMSAVGRVAEGWLFYSNNEIAGPTVFVLDLEAGSESAR